MSCLNTCRVTHRAQLLWSIKLHICEPLLKMLDVLVLEVWSLTLTLSLPLLRWTSWSGTSPVWSRSCCTKSKASRRSKSEFWSFPCLLAALPRLPCWSPEGCKASPSSSLKGSADRRAREQPAGGVRSSPFSAPYLICEAVRIWHE